MPPNPHRQLIGSLGGHTSWANTKTEDRSKRTQPARDKLEAKFLSEAEGDPVRAASIRKAYYTRLPLLSAQARARKKAKAGAE